MDFVLLREKLKRNWAGRLLLKSASKIYGWAVKLNVLMYESGWKPVQEVNSRVVCIGNITAGGTGKTTAVLLAATALAKKGIRVSIVSRGYKRQKDKNIYSLYYLLMLEMLKHTFCYALPDSKLVMNQRLLQKKTI